LPGVFYFLEFIVNLRESTIDFLEFVYHFLPGFFHRGGLFLWCHRSAFLPNNGLLTGGHRHCRLGNSRDLHELLALGAVDFLAP
jgi:hypothetical protein